MEAKTERCRVKEVDPTDCEDPELREIFNNNNNVRVMNKLSEAREQFSEGKISLVEFNKSIREADAERKETNRKLREYKKRNK